MVLSKNDFNPEMPDFLKVSSVNGVVLDRNGAIWHPIKVQYYICSICGRDIERGWICYSKNIGICDTHSAEEYLSLCFPQH